MSGSTAPRIFKPERCRIHRIRFQAVALHHPDKFHWVGKCVFSHCHRMEILTREDFASIHPSFALLDKELGESNWLKGGGRGIPAVRILGTPLKSRSATAALSTKERKS